MVNWLSDLDSQGLHAYSDDVARPKDNRLCPAGWWLPRRTKNTIPPGFKFQIEASTVSERTDTALNQSMSAGPHGSPIKKQYYPDARYAWWAVLNDEGVSHRLWYGCCRVQRSSSGL